MLARRSISMELNIQSGLRCMAACRLATCMARTRVPTLFEFWTGGALGSHFHALAAHRPWVPLHWTIWGTPAVATAGQTEFEQKCPRVTNYDSVPSKRCFRYWCRHCYGQLQPQYIEKWRPCLICFVPPVASS